MPEAPDLEVIKEFLNARVRGLVVSGATVLRPTVLRSLAGDISEDMPGRTFDEFKRRGKFLLAELSGERWLVVNPMLTGGLQYCPSSERMRKRTSVVFGLPDEMDLRYIDDRQMGKVYYTGAGQLGQIPRLDEQGPDVLEDTSLEDFRARLKHFHGEIKGVLTRGSLVSGIGNAYADEVLFAAAIGPFRKSRSLTAEEVATLHQQCRTVVEDAVAVLRERMGDRLHVKVRDFLKVHNKGGQPCPRCGGNITQLTANQVITSYCRRCQPGMLIKN
jgi:formamidopyrimidine-DNA glycosylase